MTRTVNGTGQHVWVILDALGAGARGGAANAVANCLHFWACQYVCARAPVAREWPPRKVCTGVPQTRKLLDFRWSRGREAKAIGNLEVRVNIGGKLGLIRRRAGFLQTDRFPFDGFRGVFPPC